MKRQISLLDIHNIGINYKFYSSTQRKHAAIIKTVCPIQYYDLTFEALNDIHAPQIVDILENSEGTFLFNELDYAVLLISYCRGDATMKKRILGLLDRLPYFCFFCEVFFNDDLQTLGNDSRDRTFATRFFGNSKIVHVCNTRNRQFLANNGITNNVRLFPPYGHSVLSGTCPLEPYPWQPIGLLVYGGNYTVYVHRTAFVNEAIMMCIADRIPYNVCNNLWDDKDETLRATRMVLHIPSHDIDTFPWAKTGELMAKKVFFLMEDNEEVHDLGLDGVVATFRRNDISDMRSKISLYLCDNSARCWRIEKCHEYIKTHFDLDAYLPKVLEQIMGE